MLKVLPAEINLLCEQRVVGEDERGLLMGFSDD